MKTLTFTIEDALISPIGLSILSGAGFINKGGYINENEGDNPHKENVVHVHQMGVVGVQDGIVNTSSISAGKIDTEAPIFVVACDQDGGITGEIIKATISGNTQLTIEDSKAQFVLVDYYTLASTNQAQEIQITPGDFAGSYYVEGETLWREQATGRDVPAQFVIPNAKLQSSFTITMAASGDPSTFSFAMDCLPGRTMFNPEKEVLMALELVEEELVVDNEGSDIHSVFSDGHTEDPRVSPDYDTTDSVASGYDKHVDGDVNLTAKVKAGETVRVAVPSAAKEVTSSDNTIAEASMKNGRVEISGKQADTNPVTITVKDNENPKNVVATISVTVTSA